MINNSLIKVQVQEYTTPSKPQRKIIYQRIKPFMEAYGISPESFEIKGKSVVFKTTNHNNHSYVNRSVMSVRSNKSKPNPKITIKRPQTASIQLPNNIVLPISNKYANLFNEIKSSEQKPQVQQPQKAEQSQILEEADELSDSSLIKKHDMILRDIAELEKIKQEKMQELETLQNKIEEVKVVEMNSSRFIIKKNVLKPTLREKKDKAASLIQAHVKGRIDQKRYNEWKQMKELTLRKFIYIQKWWRRQLKYLKILKQFQVTNQSKQVRLIDGHTFLIINNYSYILQRIRILFIERMGIIRGHFRLYLDQTNFAQLLNQNISEKSLEFESLLNLIINNLIQKIQIQDNQLVLNLLNQNLIDIPRLMLQVYLQIKRINPNQYQLLLNQAEMEQISKDQIEQPPQVLLKKDEKSQIQLIQDQQEYQLDQDEINQKEQLLQEQNYINEQQQNSQNNVQVSNNIEYHQLSETQIKQENIDMDQNQLKSNENNDQIQYQSKGEQNQIEHQSKEEYHQNQYQMQEKFNQNQFQSNEEYNKKEQLQQEIQSEKDNNFEINQHSQSIEESQNQEFQSQVNKEQTSQINEQKEQDQQIDENNLQKDQMEQTVQNQDLDSTQNKIQQYPIQDPLNSQIFNQEQDQFQQYVSKLKNDEIEKDENIGNTNQNFFQTNFNFLESTNNVKLCEATQIIEVEQSSSQRQLKVEKQEVQQQIISIKQDVQQEDQQSVKQSQQEDDVNVQEIEQNQLDVIKNEQEDGQNPKQEQLISDNIQNQEYILEIILQNQLESNQIVDKKEDDFEEIKVIKDKPLEVKEMEEIDDEQQIVQSEYINQQNSNIISQRIEKETSSQSLKKKEIDKKQLQLPSQIDFHMLKSCESNIFEPPNSGKETAKYLNSGELLSRTNFLSQLGQLGKFEFENNSFMGSGELKKEVEGFLAPVNLRQKNSNQQETFLESQTFPNRIPTDIRSPIIDDTFKLSTTLKFQFSSDLRAFESGQFISQQFDIKIQQQDSLEYSMDESQDLQPIYITTLKVDDNDVDVFQIKNMLRLKDKNNIYQQFDFKISKIQQSNCDYIIQNLYVYIIKNRILCIECNQILRIQRYMKRFRFVQSCILSFYKESTLVCLFKSFFKIKLSFYGKTSLGEEIIIERMNLKQRRTLEQNFISICPQLLQCEKGMEQMILATIKALEFQK